MRKSIFSLVFLLCGASGLFWSTWTEASDKWLIIPGKSAGLIGAKSSLAELQKHYGRENVESSHCGPEDEPVPCIRIKNAGVEVAVIYDDKRERTVVLSAGDWRTTTGLKQGSSLNEIVKANGKPIKVWKFDWDFKAEIQDWNQGKLSKTFGKTTSVRLFQKKGFNAKSSDSESTKLKAKLLDMEDENASFSSDEPIIQKLDLQIYEWAMTLKK